MKRLLIIGSHTFTVDAIRFAMQHTTGLSLFGVINSSSEVSPALREANPDVVVLDGVSEGNCALESLPEIRREAEDALVLLAVADDDVADTARAVEPGVVVCMWSRLVGQSSAPQDVSTPGEVRFLRQAQGVGAERPAPTSSPLTTRELETLQWVAEGHTNAWIARKLWVTEQTVKFHLTNIYRKLGVANRTEASRYALVHDLIPRPGRRFSAAPAPLPRSGDAVNG
jgi:DNA-binding NarL/FixJ family response regulator